MDFKRQNERSEEDPTSIMRRQMILKSAMSHKYDAPIKQNIVSTQVQDKSDIVFIPPVLSMTRPRSEIIKDVDHIYYNIVIPHDDNQGSQPTLCKFFEQRSSAILANPSEYYVSVVRFSLPGTDIPINIMTPGDPKVIFPDDSTVTLSFGGFNAQQKVVYIPDNKLPITAYNYQYEYSYQVYINEINLALKQAFTTLSGLVGLPAGATAEPYLIFTPSTKLFQLVCQQAYIVDPTDDTKNVQIFFNTILQNKFSSFQSIIYGYGQALGKDYRMVVSNNYNNDFTIPTGAPGATTKAWLMTQEYSTLANWNSPQRLVFISNSVPLRLENLSATFNNQQTQSVTKDSPILTDFNLPSGTDAFGISQYTPTAEYRLIDMNSDVPLNSFDIQVFIEDQGQHLHPLYIADHQEASIKIMFRRKTAMNNLF